MRKYFAIFGASIIAVAACGARSQLRVEHHDAGVEEDAGLDVADVLDAPDVVDPFPDVIVEDCQDAGITYIYVISSENELLRFYPPDLSFTSIGTIDCPVIDTNSTPFSMAVDRSGVAFVVFNDGELFRVSTLTASCKDTGFQWNQNNFPLQFGMGFSANPGDVGETLFVAGDSLDPDAGIPLGPLATIDIQSFNLTVVNNFSQTIGNPELTGTKDGKLFGFGPAAPDSHLAEIDKATAQILSDTPINLNQGNFAAWAFAFWGGDFYFFTSENQGTSVVHRYTPGGTQTPPVVAQIDLTIVGAGVSTCAPSE